MRHAFTVAAGVLALSAAACQTTGTTEVAPMLQVSYPDDAAMSCEELSTEIARMDQYMGQAEADAANAEATGRAAGAASSTAITAAGYSGLLGRAPGLGFAANAAGGLAQQNAQAEAERKEEEARRAELRRTQLSGIYAGKGCAS